MSETFEEILEWAKQAKAFNGIFGTEIGYVVNLVSIRAKVELYKKCTSDNKDEILKNLENLLKMQMLGVSAGEAQNVVVGYALKWIEDVNDLKKFKEFKHEEVKQDPETSKAILKIINQLDITEEKTQEKIKELNLLFPIPLEPVVEAPEQPVLITQRSQIIMGPPIYVRNELNVNHCKIM
mmetsp:Transcript_18483/g.18469  ORF Transcript_18483/g.18469 Transcript_18483/m.18469 type:complete len:181 (+) Transcript_18483:391-933(+)